MRYQQFYGFLRSNGVKLTLTVLLALGAFWVHLAPALATTNQVVKIALLGEPPNLNSTKATDADSFFIIGHTMEGLTRYDQAGNIVPAVAEKWEINDKTATFKIRKDVKWADGSPITAKDFVFSWRTVVDPKIASEYSFLLYHIKNAEAINTGKKPIQELGVVAKDDHTLEVTFEKPCGYFLALTTFPTYMPVKESFFKAQNGKFGAEASNILSNGPFKLTSWVHGASLRLEKNPNYWDAKSITLDAIDIPYITPNEGTRFNLFKTGRIDTLGLTKNILQDAQREKFKLNKFADGTLFFMRFNFREGRPTANKNLRLALAKVLNTNDFISKVIGIPGTLEGTGLIPSFLQGATKLFRKEYPIAARRQNLAEAKKLIADAKKELKLTGPLSLVWLTGDTPVATSEAEYFQGLFKTHLGIDLKIDKQIFKQRLAKASAGDFDIESAGWGPDYADPMTFADLFTTWNNNNNGKWENKEYDAFIRKAMNTVKPKERMDAMAAAEKILLEEFPIIPTYERTVIYTQADRLTGVVRRSVGFDPDFTRAKIIK
ncbi:MAG: peptide ABC transporter substrate-binding protein [Bdellovibrionales bacterium]|nr:peptide ABC transporter substrate-binding protein [Bdellovibrionales bacterium]